MGAGSSEGARSARRPPSMRTVGLLPQVKMNHAAVMTHVTRQGRGTDGSVPPRLRNYPGVSMIIRSRRPMRYPLHAHLARRGEGAVAFRQDSDMKSATAVPMLDGWTTCSKVPGEAHDGGPSAEKTRSRVRGGSGTCPPASPEAAPTAMVWCARSPSIAPAPPRITRPCTRCRSGLGGAAVLLGKPYAPERSRSTRRST